MTRRKGERTAQMNERDYPHIVEIDVPGSGLGMRLTSMHYWHRVRGIQTFRGGGGIKVSRWCFADAETDAFAPEFGGRTSPKQRRSYGFRAIDGQGSTLSARSIPSPSMEPATVLVLSLFRKRLKATDPAPQGKSNGLCNIHRR